MCTISDKIILCTCAIKNVETLKHCWVLYRFNNDQEEMIIGQPICFEELLQIQNFENPENPHILLRKLNSENIFDQVLEFQNKDRLQISIHFKGNELPTNYGFEFKKDKWKICEFEYFDWRYNHEECREGKIKNAVSRKK